MSRDRVDVDLDNHDWDEQQRLAREVLAEQDAESRIRLHDFCAKDIADAIVGAPPEQRAQLTLALVDRRRGDAGFNLHKLLVQHLAKQYEGP